MVENAKGFLYTGITTDLARRFREHKTDPKKGAKFFRSSEAVRMVYSKKCKNRSDASKLESAIKKKTRAQKLLMVEES